MSAKEKAEAYDGRFSTAFALYKRADDSWPSPLQIAKHFWNAGRAELVAQAEAASYKDDMGVVVIDLQDLKDLIDVEIK